MSGYAPGVEPVPARRKEHLLRWLSLALIVAVLAAAFLLPLININRYHRTISESLARSIGHPVHLGPAKLQLLPRPGLEISDFTVEEDPNFGAEPLLRSPSVVVSLRLSSLWRRRLEVSRIDLDEASVNLVHNAAGDWNFASLLEQASRIPNAPTAQRHSSGNPRFPYIEFKSARINFKSGNEKEGFAFINAELSIWLDDPNQWRIRFEAQPARTDMDLDLADTGLMRLEGSLSRAASLDQIPVKLHAEWNGAPLGQASEVLFADDMGWRGDLRAEADIAGDLRDLSLTTRLRVAGAHRQEFSPLTPLDIDARCRGEYRHATRSLDNLTCLWPVEGGHLLLTGEVPNLVTGRSRLTLEINQIPASFGLNVLGLMRAGLPSSLSAKGLINGGFTYSTEGPALLDGQATVAPLTLKFVDGGDPFMLPSLRFTTLSAPVAPAGRHKRGVRNAALVAPALPRGIMLQPATVEMGAPHPFQVSGQLMRSGFSLRITGEAQVDRLKTLATTFASLRSSMGHLAPQGTADVDMTFSGPWLAEPVALAANAPERLAGSSLQGWMHLQHAQARLDWLPEPVEIASAAAEFGGDRVRWSNMSVSVNGIAVRGSADAALRCNETDVCPMHFNLDIPNLDAATLQSALLGAGRHGELLETILAQVERQTSSWPAMSGQAQVESFALGTLALHNARVSLSVQDHQVKIASLDAAALGGSVHASGTVEASGSRPRYSLDTSWSAVSVAQVAALFNEKWAASGTIDGGAKLVLTGYSSANLASSAQGTFHWVWNSGSLLGPTGTGAAKVVNTSLGADPNPRRFGQWSASGTVANGTLTLDKAGAANPVSGTISFDRKLDLVWPGATDAQPVQLGGTLAHPVIGSGDTGGSR